MSIVSMGYHIYKNTSWSKAKVGNKVVTELETKKDSLAKRIFDNCWPYSTGNIKTDVHFFIKTESRSVHEYIQSLVYGTLPFPPGGLETPLRLTFPEEDPITLMRDFLVALHSWAFTGEMKKR